MKHQLLPRRQAHDAAGAGPRFWSTASSEPGVQCPYELAAIAQARSASKKDAIGAIAFKRSGQPAPR